MSFVLRPGQSKRLPQAYNDSVKHILEAALQKSTPVDTRPKRNENQAKAERLVIDIDFRCANHNVTACEELIWVSAMMLTLYLFNTTLAVSSASSRVRILIAHAEDPHQVAQDFVKTHKLPESYVDRIEEFLRAHIT